MELIGSESVFYINVIQYKYMPIWQQLIYYRKL